MIRNTAKAAKGQAAVAKKATTAIPPGLAAIDHIVVLMMENRSFDHMLGYLSLEGGRTDIDGLKPGMSNSLNGKTYPPRHLPDKKLGRKQDPCHRGECVTEQLSGGNGGFVKNYAATHPGDPEVDVVMGYYNAQDVPTYDFLASEFCICDRWFSSVPGETWPNRLYALTGRCDGSKNNKTPIPRYSLPSFVRHLDRANASWRWYGERPVTLALTDPNYRSSENYERIDPDFYQSAFSGRLPSVSWIDPDFGYTSFGMHQNDDHPPVTIAAGQELVLQVMHALRTGPKWDRTLLIVVYDEHGGFYDHVAPRKAADDDPAFRSYGPRVPAFIVSPRVTKQSVSHTVYDHTSIIKTILLRFASASGLPDMGARFAAAAHLGDLLTPLVRGAAMTPVRTVERVASARSETLVARMQGDGVEPRATTELTDFQKGLLRARQKLDQSATTTGRATRAATKAATTRVRPAAKKIQAHKPAVESATAGKVEAKAPKPSRVARKTPKG